MTEHQLCVLRRISDSSMKVLPFYRNQRSMCGPKIWGIDDKENTNFDVSTISALLNARLIHRVTPDGDIKFTNILVGYLEATDKGREFEA